MKKRAVGETHPTCHPSSAWLQTNQAYSDCCHGWPRRHGISPHELPGSQPARQKGTKSGRYQRSLLYPSALIGALFIYTWQTSSATNSASRGRGLERYSSTKRTAATPRALSVSPFGSARGRNTDDGSTHAMVRMPFAKHTANLRPDHRSRETIAAMSAIFHLSRRQACLALCVSICWHEQTLQWAAICQSEYGW